MFSIITPTYNRAEILARTIPEFLRMDGISECEIIVVDDGSNDGTTEILEKYRQSNPHIFRFFRQENGGPGEARNTGLNASSKEYILFLDDDVFPHPGLLKDHDAFLKNGFDVSQGILSWHPEIADDPVLQFVDRRSMQFAFDKVEDDAQLSFLQVYTANLALSKRDAMAQGAFDSKLAVKRYAFEDTAFAWDLHRAGKKIGLNRNAWAYHYHPMTPGHVVDRAYKTGYGYGVLRDEYSGIARAMNMDGKFKGAGLQLAATNILTKLPLLESLVGSDLYLRIKCRQAFIRGFWEYNHEKK